MWSKELLSKFSLSNATITESLFTSIPIPFLFRSLHSTSVVPLPHIWSRTVSPGFVYFRIRFLGIYGLQLPRYLPEWVAKSPLSGKLHTVNYAGLYSFGCEKVLISYGFSISTL